MSKIISIGWDVGGWCGTKNGFCLSEFDNGTSKDGKVHVSKLKLLKHEQILEELKILLKELKPSDNLKIVLAVDAPLGLPSSFINSISNKQESSNHWLSNDFMLPDVEGEIENPYAYRFTDKHIYSLKKKPISPVFDKLTNNFISARLILNQIRTELNVLPFQDLEPNKVICIEVYPGIFKIKKENQNRSKLTERLANAISRIAIAEGNNIDLSRLKTPIGKYYIENKEGSKSTHSVTDEVDALVCSILGIWFVQDFANKKTADDFISPPQKEADVIKKQEGWIYCPKELLNS